MADTAPSGSIEAGKAYVKMFVVDGEFKKGLQNSKKSLQDFATQAGKISAAFAAAGAAIAGSLLASAKGFAAAGAALDDMSQRTGIAAGALSEIGYAAKMSGTDLTTLETGLKAMSKALYDADEESKSAQDTLANLGLSISDLQGQTPESQFLKIADAISKVSDPTRQAALALKVFGGAGQKLLPLLAGGSEAIAKMRKEGVSLGQTFTSDMASGAAALDDELEKLSGAFEAVKNTIGEAVAGPLTKWLEQLNESSPAILKAIGENKEWVIWIGKISLELTAVAAIMGGASIAAYSLATAIGVLQTATTGLSLTLGLLTGAGIVVALALITNEIVNWNIAHSKLNKELQRTIDLREKLAKTKGQQADKNVEGAANMGGDSRRQELQGLIAGEEKNLPTQQSQVEKARKEVEHNQFMLDKVSGDDSAEARYESKLEGSKSELADAESILKSTQDNIGKYQTELAEFEASEKERMKELQQPFVEGMSQSNIPQATNADGTPAQSKFDGLSFGDMLAESARQDALAADEAQKALQEEADAVAEAVMSPAERLKAKLARLDFLHDAGKLTDDAYDKATKQEKLSAAQAAGQSGMQDAGNRMTNAAALQQGTSEAFSAMVKAMNGTQNTDKAIAKNTELTAKGIDKLARKKDDKINVKVVDF